MAKTTFDIKIDLKTEATRSLYAIAGAADLAVAAVREYAADVQEKLTGVQKDVETRIDGVSKTVSDLDADAVREQAATAVNARVDALTKDAKARREAIEARVAELQDEAKALPSRFQIILDENVATATAAYADLAKRGEILVSRVRGQESTKATAKAAKTTVAKAKTTTTQAKKAAPAKKVSTAKAAPKKAASTAKKTATAAKKSATTTAKTAAKKTATPRSSAKATTTAAKKTVSSAATAATEAAAKVGD